MFKFYLSSVDRQSIFVDNPSVQHERRIRAKTCRCAQQYHSDCHRCLEVFLQRRPSRGYWTCIAFLVQQDRRSQLRPFVPPVSCRLAPESPIHAAYDRSRFEATATNAILLLFLLPRFSVLLTAAMSARRHFWSAAARRRFCICRRARSDPSGADPSTSL